MNASPKNRSFALSLAALAGFSVILQCRLSLQTATHNGKSIGAGLAIFFSYFTVLTNTLVFISLALALIGPASPAQCIGALDRIHRSRTFSSRDR